MIPIVNNRFEEPEIKYQHAYRMPKSRRNQTAAQYRVQFASYEQHYKNKRQEKDVYRAFGCKAEDLPPHLFKLLRIILFNSYAKGRRFQPLETHQRALAAAMGLIGRRARKKVKEMLDELIELGFIRVIREPRGPVAGLYLPVTHHNQPPPATVAINSKRPQRSRGLKAAKKNNKSPQPPKTAKFCGLNTKKAARGGAKEMGGIKKGATCQTTPISATPKGGFEQYLPRHVAESLGYDSAPPQSTEHDQESATMAGLETVQAEQKPHQDSPPSPSMQQSAPTVGTETAPKPTEAAPDSPEAARTVDTAPATLPALDPALTAVQGRLDAARQAQGIPAPVGPQPSIERVQTKLMERRRWQDNHTVRKTMKSIGEPLDRAPGTYTVVYKDPNDHDKAPLRTRQQFGGGPVRQAGTPTQKILGGIRIADEKEIAQLLAEEKPN